MRVWPLEAGFQEQAANRLKLLWSKAMVVSVKEKLRHMIVAGGVQGDEMKISQPESTVRRFFICEYRYLW